MWMSRLYNMIGEGVVCHILGMLVIYVGLCGIGMVVYVLLVAINALDSECRNVALMYALTLEYYG